MKRTTVVKNEESSIRRTIPPLVTAGLLSLLLAAIVPFTASASVPYAIGDVFVGVGNGFIKHFNGNGVLLETLNTGTTCAEQLGMTFRKSNGHLLATSSFGSCFGAGRVVEFDNVGNLVGPFGGPYSTSTESVVLDSSGNVYVGQPDGTRRLAPRDRAEWRQPHVGAGRQRAVQ